MFPHMKRGTAAIAKPFLVFIKFICHSHRTQFN